MQQSTAIKLIKKYLKVLDENNFPYEDVYLFGSRARGDNHRDSDIDVCLISNKYSDNDVSKFSLKASELREKVSLYIEPHLIEKQDFGKWHPLGGYVLQDGIKILSKSSISEQRDIDTTNREEYIKFQLSDSKLDLDTFKLLFKSKRYFSSLCFGERLIEKSLRAVVVSTNKKLPIYTKDIVKLASSLEVSSLTSKEKELIKEIGQFNIYIENPILEKKLRNKATKEYTDIKYAEILKLYKKILKKV